MGAGVVGVLPAGDTTRNVATSISDRLSQELVIALVGPVGSGVTTAAQLIRDLLVQDFGYKVAPIIKPSDIIRAESHRVGIGQIRTSPHDVYITDMQTAGNALRQKFGANYLAEKTVERIYKFRLENGGLNEDGSVVPGRRAYIIDSIKNPEELALLKQIYEEQLCVFGIFAPDEMRRQRLIDHGSDKAAVDNVLTRDRGEPMTFGQRTRKVFVEADFFICNDRKVDELRSNLSRQLHIVFSTSVHTPTRAESAMYEASSAAANSACMSRQVGAAVVSAKGELIAVGWNDVPRFGGGLYGEDDRSVWDEGRHAVLDKDSRCFKWGGCVCHNEVRRTGIVDEIAQKIYKSSVVRKGTTYKQVRALLEGTKIDALIEFSRSIHAEMEAILSVAREGRNSLVGATLYTNTYPCHNCARHIVASGIANVVYIEPYDKSLATTLHSDAISENPDDATRVVFRQYDGVAPRNYLRLFRSGVERKENGKIVRRDPREALPLFRMQLDAFTDYEAKVIANLTDKEQNPDVGTER
ncbi:MAG: anti-phage dCTP deaminase [Methylobacterium radiotolerans]